MPRETSVRVSNYVETITVVRNNVLNVVINILVGLCVIHMQSVRHGA